MAHAASKVIWLPSLLVYCGLFPDGKIRYSEDGYSWGETEMHDLRAVHSLCIARWRHSKSPTLR